MSENILTKDSYCLSIPDRLDCVPRRAGQTGGRYRNHPGWTELVESTEPSAADLTYLGTPTLRSVHSANAYKITHRSSTSTFAFLSVKSGRTQTGESHYELAWAQNLEVDPTYVDYQTHGIEVNYRNGAAAARYTPDAVALTADVAIECHEVKATRSYFQVGSYAKLMDKVDLDLSSYGITLRRVTGADIEANRRRHYNISTAFQERFTYFGPRHEDGVRNLLERSTEQAFARVLEEIDPDVRKARPILNSMLCRRKLVYDLNQRITGDTIVRGLGPVPSFLPDIRAF